ncbi:MAG: LuxR C-terminal-related transcriptional regulator [Treponema sp.]|jgi:LuxR family maltose regulon positive regulatory protein|nr:LuxR C-terminal-related transcriptional regulator [Treponema sp.]
MQNKIVLNTEFPNVPVVLENQLYLKRPCIHQLLEKAVKSPLVTVVAGAGYGKTHAIYSFLREYNVISSWIQLSDRDNDGNRFWENFLHAVTLISKTSAEKLAGLGFPRTEREYDRYFSISHDDVISGLKYIFVYDDFHLLYNTDVLRFMERTTVPFRNITSIIISRKEPAINLMSLLSKGLLARVTEDDLRFTKKEMLEYFSLQGVSLPEDAAAEIYRDTEGWAFAIHLSALSLKNGVPPEHGRTSMKLNIFKLIESEVFSSVTAELQKYLIKLSLIDHLPLELIRDIAEDRNLIQEMERIGAFIYFDTYLNSYRIHHLFQAYLNGKQDLLSADEKRDVYAKAGKWCAAHNLKMDALNYYEKAGDYTQIIALVYTLPLIMHESIAKLLMDIFNRAPKSLFETNATALVVHTRLFITLGRFTEAETLLRAIIKQAEGMEDSAFKSSLLFRCYNNLGFLRILTCPFTNEYDFGSYFERGAFYQLSSEYQTSGPTSVMAIMSYACRVGETAGKESMDKYLEAITAAVPMLVSSLNGCAYGWDDLARAELEFFKGRLEEAEQYGYLTLRKAPAKNQYEIENRALFYLLRICLALGDYERIKNFLKRIETQREIPIFANRAAFCDIVSGWFFAHLGMSERLAHWLKSDFEESDLNSLIHGLETLVRVKCQFAEKRYPAVLAALKSATITRFGAGAYLLGKIEQLVMEAVCRYHLDDKENALKALEAAYLLAEPNGLDMPFIEMGKDMRTLAGAALKEARCAIPRYWLEKVQRAAAAYGKKFLVVVEKFREEDRAEDSVSSLSPREMEVLTGLSRGLTREELAEDGDISINTVKSALRSVYTKLGAVNRADAIRIATVQGIIKG